MKARFLIPFGIFVALVVFFAIGLNRDPHEIPSPLIDKPAPAFSLPRLQETNGAFAPETMRGKVWLLNVWATWCVACREEHPVLVELAQSQQVPIIGLNYKEVRGDTSINAEQLSPAQELTLGRERIRTWFSQHGNPYALTALDLDGRVGIDYGVYGVPESYVIDKQGVIRMKHIGPLTPEVLQAKILPLIRTLSK